MIIETGSLIMLIVCASAALLFLALAVWIIRRKKPIHFVSGTTVKPEEISDIPAYNKENGIMWLIYGGGFVLAGIISLFHAVAAAVVIVILSIPGIGFLAWNYRRIYNKYKV